MAIKDIYEFVLAQMASESYLDNLYGTETFDINDPADLNERLLFGGNRYDKIADFTESELSPTRMTQQMFNDFNNSWEVITHLPNQASGFSATLLQHKDTDEFTLSFRGTEFKSASDGGDFNRDIGSLFDATFGADLEIGVNGFSVAQIQDMQTFYENLKAGKSYNEETQRYEGDADLNEFALTMTLGNQLNVTGYSLGGHLAQVFTRLNYEDIRHTYTFNGAGLGNFTGDLESLEYTEALKAYFEDIANVIANPLAEENVARITKADLARISNVEQGLGIVNLIGFGIREALQTVISSKADDFFSVAGKTKQALLDGLSQGASEGIVDYIYNEMLNSFFSDDDVLIFIEAFEIIHEELIAKADIRNSSTYVDPLYLYALEVADQDANGESRLEGVISGSYRELIGRYVPDHPFFDDLQNFILNIPFGDFARSLLPFGIGDALPYLEFSREQIVEDEKITNIFGDEYVLEGFLPGEFVAGSGLIYGDTQSVFIPEQPLLDSGATFPTSSAGPSHSITLLADSLALMSLIEDLDKDIGNTGFNNNNFAAINNLLASASSRLANTTFGTADGESLTSVLNALGGIFVGESYEALEADNTVNAFGDLGNRNNFYNRIQAIRARTFDANGDLNSEFSNLSIFSFVTPGVEADAIASLAKTSIATRYALNNLQPFALLGVDSLFEDFNQNGELNYSPNGETNGLTDEYIDARASFVELVVDRNLSNFDNSHVYDSTKTNLTSESYFYEDIDNNIKITPKNFDARTQRIIFAPNESSSQLNGADRDDKLFGQNGNDVIIGGGGRDYLEGGKGSDTLIHHGSLNRLNDDQDILVGGEGLDNYFVGDEDIIIDSDRQVRSINFDGVIVAGVYEQDGTDSTTYTNSETNLQISISGNDAILTNPNNNDSFTIKNFLVEDSTLSERENGEFGIFLNEFIEASSVLSLTQGDDNAVAGDFDTFDFDDFTQVNGLGGNDLIGAANDVLGFKVYGGDGDDILWADDIPSLTLKQKLEFGLQSPDRIGAQLFGELGNDGLEGSGNSDYANGGEGDDYISLFTGYDVGVGGSGNDHISGGDQNDIIDGGSGNDILLGGQDNDSIIGGAGNDLIMGDARSQFAHSIRDNIDELLTPFTGALQNKQFNFNLLTRSLLPFTIIDAVLDDSYNQIVEYFGEDAGEDFLDGGGGDDYIRAGQGDDTLFGGTDDDLLEGDEGNDTLFGGSGNDILYGDINSRTYELATQVRFEERVEGTIRKIRVNYLTGAQIQQLDSTARNIMEDGEGYLQFDSDGIYTFITQNQGFIESFWQYQNGVNAGGDDELYGGTGSDKLFGGVGNDLLDGGVDGVFDQLYGGEGNDTYQFGFSYGNDIIRDESGDNDVLKLGVGISRTNVELLTDLTGNNLLISLKDDDGNLTGDKVSVINWFNGKGIDSIEFADGSIITATAIEEETEQARGDGSGNSDPGIFLSGDIGNDIGQGTSAKESIFTFTGNDIAFARGGDDNVFGGDGDDTLYGNEGNDVLSGENDNDELYGQIGNDELYGGEGNDVLSGEQGNDTLSGGVGDDDLLGGIGDDTYHFARGDGQDFIIEEGGTDTLAFAAGIQETDLVFTRDNNVGGPDNLIIQLRDGNQFTNDAVVIENWFTVDNQVENISFADGSTLDVADIQARLPDTQIIDTAGSFTGGAGITSYEILPDNLTDNFTITIDDQGGLDRLDIDEGFYSNGSVSGFASVELISTSRSDNDLTLNLRYSGPEGSFDFSGSVVITNYYTSSGFIEDIFIENQLQNAINAAPVVNGVIPEQVAELDQSFNLQLANDFFTDSDFDRLNITATLADGSELPSWLSFDADSLSFSGTPTLGDDNIQDIRITATDTEGLTASSDFTLFTGDINLAPRVDAPIDDQTVKAQDTLNFTVDSATFADANTNDTLSLSATLANGDTLPGWLSFDTATQTFSGTPGDIDVGELGVRVTATDDDGAFITDDFVLAINPFNTAPEAVRETVSINLEDAGSQQIEFILNEDTTTQRNDSNVTALSNGNYVYTWSELTDNRFTIQARIYDSNYQLVRDNFELLPTDSTIDYKVTSLNSGGFALSSVTSEAKIQRFDSNGDTVGSEAIFLSGLTNATEREIIGGTIDVTSRDDGSFIVVWAEETGTTLPNRPFEDAFRIAGRIVNSDNTINSFEPSAIEYWKRTPDTVKNSSPTVTSLNNGAFIIGWGPAAQNSNDDFESSYFATFDANANRTSEQLFSLEGRQLTTTSFSNDRYLISFSGSEGRTGQFVNSSGGLIGSAFVLNPNNQAGSSVITALSNNDYVMLGIEFDATTGERSLIASRITQSGEITVFNVSDSFNVNRNIINNIEDLPSVAELSDGSLVFTWTTDDPDEVNVFDNDIATRIFPSEAQTSAFLIDVLANDTDVDVGDTLTLQSVSVDPDKGSVSIENNQVRFDPGADFSDLQAGDTESLEVTYTIADAQGETSTVTSTFIIRGFGTTEGGINLDSDVPGILDPGADIRSAGDINNDGLDDIIVLGAVEDSPGGFIPADAYVVYGSTDRITSNIDLTTLDGTNGFRLFNNSEFGLSSIESAGDINGDGIDDLIVGSLQASVDGNLEGGAAYVLYGDADGFDTNVDLSLLDGTTGFQISGLLDEQNIGGSVDGAGDVNGDGINDLIISLPQFSDDGGGASGGPGGPGDSGFEGATYILFGDTNGFSSNIVLDDLDSSNYIRLIGDAESFSGARISYAGDVNNDGFDDVLVSFDEVEGGSLAYLIYGSVDQTGDILLSDLDGADGSQFFSSTTELDLFNALGNAGDINADGITDFIVGNAVIFGSEFGYSASNDISLLNGTNGFVIDDSVSPDFFAVSAAGDVNADGIDDLLIGLPDASPNTFDFSGSSYIVFGKADAFLSTLDVSTLSSEEAIQFNGTTNDALSGTPLRNLGDIDGDGFADIGIHSRDTNGESITHIVYGKDYRNEIDILGTNADDIITVTEDNQKVFALGGDDIINVGEVENTTIFNGQGNFEVNVSDSSGRTGFSIRNSRSSSSNSNSGGFNTLNINSRNGSYIARVTGGGIVAVNVKTGETVTSWSNRRGSLILDVNDGQFEFVFEDVDVDNLLDITEPFTSITFNDELTLSYEDIISAGFDVDGTELNDELQGSQVEDRVNAFAGDDTITTGEGDDYINAGDGDDSVNAGQDDDYLIGGQGFDYLEGGLGDDSYLYNVNDGVDYIYEEGGNDQIIFGAGISIADIRVELDFEDLFIEIDGSKSITVESWLDGTEYQIEQFIFTDDNGLVLNASDIEALAGGVEYQLAPFVVNPIINQIIDEDNAFSFTVPTNSFIDKNTDNALTYTASLADDSGLPSWLSFDAATQTFSGTPTNDEVGSLDITVTATDTGGLSASDIFSVTVNNVNDNPLLANAISDQTVDEDTAFSFTVPSNTFSDDDAIHGDTLSYSATLADDSVLPTWLSFDAATQTFSGIPTNDEVGSLNIKVTATDTGGLSGSDTFSVTINNINDAPVLDTSIADQTTDEDSLFSFTVPSNTFTDENIITGDSLSYSATLADDSALPSWLSFDAATQTFTGTPTNKEVGSLDIKVTATDTGGLSVSDTFSVSINNVNDNPLLANAISDQSVDEDSAFSFTVPTNTFSDDDAIHGDALSYSASLADDSTLPSWLSFDAATQTFSGTPTNDEVGSLDIKVTATDTGGLSVSDTFSVSINNINDNPLLANAITDQTIDEDTAFSFTVPTNTFSDDDAIHGDTLSYSATLSDDSALPTWLSFDAATQTFSGTPTNDEVGSLDIKVTATDTGGLSVSDTFSVSINNVNDNPLLANAISDQSVDEDSAFSFTVPTNTFSDDDAIHGDALSYSASLADDSTLPSWLSFDAATQTFSGTPDNGDVGSLDVKVTATDTGGLSVSDTFSVSINNINDNPLLANAISDQSVDEDTAFSFTVPTNTFSDDDAIHGDTLTYSATLSDDSVLPSWLSFDAATQIFSGTPTNDEVGSLDIKVTATDTGGLSISDTFSVTVNNVNDAPTLDAEMVDQIAMEDNEFTFQVPSNTFSDDDAIHGDTLTYNATLADDSALPTWLSFDAATQTFSGTPDNGNVGNLDVKVTATDTGGLSISDTFNLQIEAVQTGNVITGTSGRDFLFGTFEEDVINALGGNDKVFGLSSDDVINGGDGHDKLFGNHGDDILNGGNGNDQLIEWYGNNTLNGDAGNDYLLAGWGNDTLSGGDGNDTLYGGRGGDILQGDAGIDYLYGGSGDDDLSGGTGNDVIKGERGDDTYHFGVGDGRDVIKERNGDDTLRFGADIEADDLWFSREGRDLKINIIDTEDSVRIDDWYRNSSWWWHSRDYKIETIELANGQQLVESQVQNLVDAMAGFNVNTSGELNISQDIREQLDTTIAASWV